MVIALAGRRIDAAGAATARFPLARAGAVREKLLALFRRRGATALVASAACGADLVALDAARELGMRLRVVLPFDEETFRRSSVDDRPGDWGPLYDRVVADARAADDLVELRLDPSNGEAGYEAAARRILDEASALGADGVVAVSVSEGASRGEDDMTERFAALARARGLEIEAVDTLR